MWTTAGLMAAEYKAADDPVDPGEAMRLVRLDLSSGHAKSEPRSRYRSGVEDVGVSIDGATIAAVRRDGDRSVIDVEGGRQLSRAVQAGAGQIDVWDGGAVVGYLGSDGFYRVWKLGESTEGTVKGHWSYVAAASTQGEIALAELSEQTGPTGEICIVSMDSLAYAPVSS